MKIAIIHDWLTVYAGAERCLEQMLECFPDADMFALIDFVPEAERGFLKGKTITTSFMQKLPFVKTRYRTYLPLMPLAVEQFDLSGYDLIISSTHAVAKGVLVGPDQLHLSYVYSPIRYAWDLQFQYLRESRLDRGLKSWMARILLHRIRLWDSRTATGVDRFIAISHFVGRRIAKIYRRDSRVIYPPVAVESFTPGPDKADFYLTSSRMVPYKKMPLIVEAFAAMPEKRLVVIGTGPEFEKCRSLAGPNVSLLGWQPEAVLRDHLQRARAFVFAAEEDFGIAPLEAQACGTPVLAYGKGGVRETLVAPGASGPSALFFDEQTKEAIIAVVERFEQGGHGIEPEHCRANAMRFSTERFRTEFKTFVEEQWALWKHEIGRPNGG